MQGEKASYRQVIKATSLFGGVQIFNIIISLIRSKVIAVLLGPAGIGILGLFNSAIGIISNATNLGLGTSAIKDIASANNSGDKNRIGIIVKVVKRLVWFTGVIGLSITLIFSSWLSQLTFGSTNYTTSFAWISISLLFSQLSTGKLVILQGMRKLQYLAKANVLGGILGLIISLPLYYFLRIEGIVPGILVTTLITLIVYWYYSKKVFINQTSISFSQIISEGSGMVKMGFLISISGLLTIGSSYIVRIYIGREGGMDQVGLYSAGFAIINTYVGLIFNAMGTDYYPRLSAVSDNEKLFKQTVNQQAEIAILILAPLLLIFLTFIKWVIILLYSNQFVEANEMIYWASLGLFFKAASWSISYIFLAKSASKLFFWNELITNIYLLGFNILGYHLWGLTGLGVSFVVSYFIYFVQVFIVSKIKFSFSFNVEFIKIFMFHFSLAILGFLSINYLDQNYAYLIGIVLIAISSYYSIIELDKRIGIKDLWLKMMSKK